MNKRKQGRKEEKGGERNILSKYQEEIKHGRLEGNSWIRDDTLIEMIAEKDYYIILKHNACSYPQKYLNKEH